jgi:hypothetical protein
MSRAGCLLWVALIGGACNKNRDNDAPRAKAVIDSCPVPQQVNLPELPGPKLEPAKPQFDGELFLPPEVPGATRTESSGCVDLVGDGELGAKRFPPATTEAKAKVSALTRGVLITHDLNHRCCLKAKVSATVSGEKVRVIETLTGTACACDCASTLRTAVGLMPGKYELQLSMSDQGKERQVFQGPVEIAP